MMLLLGEGIWGRIALELNIKLDNFEGPLELLLHLVESKEMSIYEINISKLIDEYLSLISSLTDKDIQIKVEFLVMATELLEIKALSVLNYKKKLEKEKALEQKLIDYKVIKYLANDLQSLEKEYNVPLKREGIPVKLDDFREIDLSKLTLTSIFETYLDIMKQSENREVMEIDLEEIFSMNDEMKVIEKDLSLKNKLSISSLFQKAKSKLHLVYLFLAVLELYRERIVEIEEEYLVKVEENLMDIEVLSRAN